MAAFSNSSPTCTHLVTSVLATPVLFYNERERERERAREREREREIEGERERERETPLTNKQINIIKQTKRKCLNWVWRLTSLILALGRQLRRHS